MSSKKKSSSVKKASTPSRRGRSPAGRSPARSASKKSGSPARKASASPAKRKRSPARAPTSSGKKKSPAKSPARGSGSKKKKQESELYEVESILDKRTDKGGVFYKVRWKGYSSAHDSWEPKENLKYLDPSLMLAFIEQRGGEVTPARTPTRAPSPAPAQKSPASSNKKTPTKRKSATSSAAPSSVTTAEARSPSPPRSRGRHQSSSASQLITPASPTSSPLDYVSDGTGYSSASDVEDAKSSRLRAPNSINPCSWVRYFVFKVQNRLARLLFSRRHRGPEPEQIMYETRPRL